MAAIIPAGSNPSNADPVEPKNLRWRILVERSFYKLANWGRTANRYDKTAASCLGLVALASVTLWLPLVHAA